MQFKRLHPDFVLPTKGSEAAGGWDLTMPTAGRIHRSEHGQTHTLVKLGFAAKVPDGHVALILPRSGAGAKFGVELRNTVGVIDADYTGEWMVAAKQKEGQEVDWSAGDRLFQFIVVPVATVQPEEVDELPGTARGEGGFGSTGTGKITEEVTSREPEGKPVKKVEQVGGGVPAKAAEPTPAVGEAKPATAPAPKVEGEAKAATTATPKVDGAAQVAE
jgi:dUTP pyrophosphatase